MPTINEDAVCKHCHKVIATVPKHYCPRSPNQTHEPVASVVALSGGVIFTGGTPEQNNILRKRGEFVAQYCQERGWDIDKVTIQQVMEIRSQPGWKNPNADEDVPEQPVTKTGTIDITPVGCQTPEGNARVAKAMKAFDDSSAEVANKATEFLRELLLEVKIPNALADDLKELTAAINRRKAIQEAFLRAVASAPHLTL